MTKTIADVIQAIKDIANGVRPYTNEDQTALVNQCHHITDEEAPHYQTCANITTHGAYFNPPVNTIYIHTIDILRDEFGTAVDDFLQSIGNPSPDDFYDVNTGTVSPNEYAQTK